MSDASLFAAIPDHYVAGSAVPADGQWHSLTVVHDVDSDTVYVDGDRA